MINIPWIAIIILWACVMFEQHSLEQIDRAFLFQSLFFLLLIAGAVYWPW